MKHIEGTFTGFGGLHLYYQGWQPEQERQAVVVIVHGLGGHSGLFGTAVEYLVSQGYDTYSFDLRGHGRSPGQRGYINRWAEFREDLHLFLQHIHEQSSSSPCPYFLWGHSLGGTIVLDYALRSLHNLDGLIVTAPALEKVGVSPVKLAIGRLLSGVYPRFSIKLGISNDMCQRDPDACVVYLQDSLRHEFGSARLTTEFFATVNWIYQHLSDLRIPLLLLHCSNDEVTLAEASRGLFQKVMFPDKEHHEYSGCYHDIYIDHDHPVLRDLRTWLERQSNKIGNHQSLAI